MTDELAGLRAQRRQLDDRIARAEAADLDAFEEALERLYEAVLAYAADHQLPVDEDRRKNVGLVSFAGLRLELGHDDPDRGLTRSLAVTDEPTGCRVDFSAAPYGLLVAVPPPQALLGLIDGFLASRAAGPATEPPAPPR